MSAQAIVMMIAFMLVIWGGLVLALVRMQRAPLTPAAIAEDEGRARPSEYPDH